MDLQSTLFTILFAAIFFMLGLMYRIIADFRSEVTEKLDKFQESFLAHILSHIGNPVSTRKRSDDNL